MGRYQVGPACRSDAGTRRGGAARRTVYLVSADPTGAHGLADTLSDPLHAEGFDTVVQGGVREPDDVSGPDGAPPDAVVVVRVREADLAGLALCRALRRIGPRRVIIAVTGGGACEVVTVFESGADDCVVHPVAPAELVARLLAHLRRAEGMRPPRP